MARAAAQEDQSPMVKTSLSPKLALTWAPWSNEEYLAGKSRPIEEFLAELKADTGKKKATRR